MKDRKSLKICVSVKGMSVALHHYDLDMLCMPLALCLSKRQMPTMVSQIWRGAHGQVQLCHTNFGARHPPWPGSLCPPWFYCCDIKHIFHNACHAQGCGKQDVVLLMEIIIRMLKCAKAQINGHFMAHCAVRHSSARPGSTGRHQTRCSC